MGGERNGEHCGCDMRRTVDRACGGATGGLWRRGRDDDGVDGGDRAHGWRRAAR